MDSKHLILKKDVWLERLEANGADHVTAYPNLIGVTRNGWLASFKEAHRTCLLADENYEFLIFGSKSESDSRAFEQIELWLQNHSQKKYDLKVLLHD